MSARTNPADTQLLFEIGTPGRRCMRLPHTGIPRTPAPELVPGNLRRTQPAELPEVGELDIVRHFNNLSAKNYSVDRNFYPLGSCTMKYNPKVCDKAASMPEFAEIHPYQPPEEIQGALELMYRLQEYLKDVSGLDAVTLQPAAGAHGELTGIMCFQAWFRSRGEHDRREIIIPDSAHGTNPATCGIAGFTPIEIASNADGGVDLDALRAVISPRTAGMMITNPSTLGLFESNIRVIADELHKAGALLYMDGANMNALAGMARPGDFGVDCMHFNLHKTFAVPHGGGGPGAGPIAVSKALEPFLPNPRIRKEGERYTLDFSGKQSIGQVRSYYGNFLALVRAYVYMRLLGGNGIREMSRTAVLNANYLMARLKGSYHLLHDRYCMHEAIFTDAIQAKESDLHAVDIAKRLLDYGIHPMTIYFPLRVVTGGHGAIMIEPTETESKQTMDYFVEVMEKIALEARKEPELLRDAPHHSPVRRLDEVRATTNPVLCHICS